MRLLIFSDSHGTPYYMRKALMRHPEAEVIIFLGDGEYDFGTLAAELNGRPVIKVRGNCDYGSDLPQREIFDAAGYKVYCTHGYAEQVKYGMYLLSGQAADAQADLVLFGHTHEQTDFYEDGIHYLNPGSAADGFYGMADLLPEGIATIKARIV